MINNAVIRHCMGDLEIDEHSAGWGSDSWPVAVLYAAGEVAGGATATIDWGAIPCWTAWFSAVWREL